MDHVMLDIETLDTAPSAVVLSIGAVAFNPLSGALGSTFYANMVGDVDAQQRRGRTISGQTVRWWVKQDEAAKRMFQPSYNDAAMSTSEALVAFAAFITTRCSPTVKVWGNGADFDNIILGTLYDSWDMFKPWSYGRNRCYRTLKNLGVGPNELERTGVHHNALDDAISQAQHLQRVFPCLHFR